MGASKPVQVATTKDKELEGERKAKADKDEAKKLEKESKAKIHEEKAKKLQEEQVKADRDEAKILIGNREAGQSQHWMRSRNYK